MAAGLSTRMAARRARSVVFLAAPGEAPTRKRTHARGASPSRCAVGTFTFCALRISAQFRSSERRSRSTLSFQVIPSDRLSKVRTNYRTNSLWLVPSLCSMIGASDHVESVLAAPSSSMAGGSGMSVGQSAALRMRTLGRRAPASRDGAFAVRRRQRGGPSAFRRRCRGGASGFRRWTRLAARRDDGVRDRR